MKRAMLSEMRVECNKESNGFGGKSDGNEGGRRSTVARAMVMVMATTWAMAMVMRLAGDKEGKGEGGKGDGNGDVGSGRRRGQCDGSKSNGNGNKGGGRATATGTKRVMVKVTRVWGERRQWQ